MPLRDDGRDDRRDGEPNLHKHQPIRARCNFPRRSSSSSPRWCSARSNTTTTVTESVRNISAAAHSSQPECLLESNAAEANVAARAAEKVTTTLALAMTLREWVSSRSTHLGVA